MVNFASVLFYNALWLIRILLCDTKLRFIQFLVTRIFSLLNPLLFPWVSISSVLWLLCSWVYRKYLKKWYFFIVLNRFPFSFYFTVSVSLRCQHLSKGCNPRDVFIVYFQGLQDVLRFLFFSQFILMFCHSWKCSNLVFGPSVLI